MNNTKPTESELAILQILWDKGPSSVRNVNDKLNLVKESGYTTTLKLMQIMTEKGLTERDTSSRTHIYKALVTEEITKTDLLDRFISATFKGSASKLVMSALGNAKTSPAELEEIKALISQIENQQDDGNIN